MKLDRNLPAAQAAAADPTRTRHLAAIHIAEKALGIDKDEASYLKSQVTGLASAREMNYGQRRRYLAHLSGLQANAARARGEKPAYESARRHQEQSAADLGDARWGKARAMWHALALAGHVRTDTDAALTTYVQRQTKRSAWRFLNGHEINSVIEALKDWCDRVGVPTEA